MPTSTKPRKKYRPKREPLTEDEIADLWLDSISGPLTATKFARAIERAHGINVPELPVQYAEPEPDQKFGFDRADFAILGGAMAVVFVLGFGVGRAWA